MPGTSASKGTRARESRTMFDRLRIWRTGRSFRDLVEGWRGDLDRHQEGERAVLGKAHADSARQIDRQVREAYRSGLLDAEWLCRLALPGFIERNVERERGRSIPPGPPQPRGPDREGIAVPASYSLNRAL